LVSHTKLAHEKRARHLAAAAMSTVSTATGASATASHSTAAASSCSDGDLPAGQTTQLLSKKMRLIQKCQSADGTQTADTGVKIASEVSTYLHLESLTTCDTPLEFWKRNHMNFPSLSILACNYLFVSASSVPVEAMFSTCGLMLNQKRSSMTPYRANRPSVVHDNYGKFFPVNQQQAMVTENSAE